MRISLDHVVRSGAAEWLTGIPVMEHRWLPDGQVIMTSFNAVPVAGPAVLVGTCPLSELEQAGRDGRLAVRRGLADVLEWLGHPVENEPTGKQILAMLRPEAR